MEGKGKGSASWGDGKYGSALCPSMDAAPQAWMMKAKQVWPFATVLPPEFCQKLLTCLATEPASIAVHNVMLLRGLHRRPVLTAMRGSSCPV